ncbi:beta-lactamase-like protein, partial [Blastocladiella britannica]
SRHLQQNTFGPRHRARTTEKIKTSPSLPVTAILLSHLPFGRAPAAVVTHHWCLAASAPFLTVFHASLPLRFSAGRFHSSTLTTTARARAFSLFGASPPRPASHLWSTQRRTMKYSVQILGAGSADMPPSLLFMFDSQRYLINCGEGTQRFCAEHKVRIPKIKHILLTRLQWEAVGGLPGFLLTHSDVTAESKDNAPVTIHGPPNTTRFLASLRHFIHPRSMKFELQEYPAASGVTELQRDENVVIKAVTLVSGSPAPTAEVDLATETEAATEGEIAFDTEGPMDLLEPIPAADPHDELASRYTALLRGEPSAAPVRNDTYPLFGTAVDSTIVTLVKGPEVPGRFLVDKAKSFKIPPGALYGRLHRGETVTLPDGRAITPDMVLGPGKPGQVFVIFDLPNLAYLKQAAASDQVAQLVRDHPHAEPIVFHMLGNGLARTPEFASFVGTASHFSPGTRHIVLGPDTVGLPVSFTSFGVAQSMLAQLVPEFFPTYQFTPAPVLTDIKDATGAAPLFSALQTKTSRVAPGAQLTEIQIEPKFAISAITASSSSNSGNDVEATARSIIASTPALAKHAAAAAAAYSTGAPPAVTEDDGDWVVVPLGTGSAIPSKFRNVSSTLISMPRGSVLLDCGEGSLGQLARLLPSEGSPAATAEPSNLVHYRHKTVQDLYKSIHLVFISHLHADHHLGLSRLLLATSHPITIVGPWRLWNYLRELNSFHPVGLDRITFIDAGDLLLVPSDRNAPVHRYGAGRGGAHRPATSHNNGQLQRKQQPSPAPGRSSRSPGPSASRLVPTARAASPFKNGAESEALAPSQKRGRSPASQRSPSRERKIAAVTATRDDVDAVEQQRQQSPSKSRAISLQEELKDFDMIEAANIPRAPHALAQALEQLGLASLHTTAVVHRSYSYAVRLVSASASDLSLVFSGDTRPTAKLVQLGCAGGIQPGLLVHEATFESEMGDEARKKAHSTTAEAVQVFESMGARSLMLTHFSQRYPKLPRINRAAQPDHIVVAFDLIAVPLRRVRDVARHMPAIDAACAQQTALAIADEGEASGF